WTGYNPSGIEVKVKHTWSEKGDYTIKAKAKDIHDAEGPEGTLEVTMPKNKAFNFNFPLLNWLFERFPNAFPILRHLLEL
ncbi:MAG: Zn-dependent exopeptidase M28, partial [Thermoplasmatales archaeon]|nr:Zn-dependent exopeptidase M28 [Thermoplasmatales archaeon]